MNKRKYFLIFFILLIAVGLAYFGRGFINGLKEKNNDGQKQQGEQALPFSYLSEKAVLAPVLSVDEQSLWYFDAESSELYQRTLTNTIPSKYPLPEHGNIKFALWPAAGSDFIIGTENGRYLYDSTKAQFYPYPNEIKFVDWLPVGSRVALIALNSVGPYLGTGDSRITEPREVARLPHEGFQIAASPNGKSFVLYSASGNDPLYFIVDGLGALESLSGNQKVQSLKFSPDGRSIAYVAEQVGKRVLYVLNISTSEQDNSKSVEVSGDYVWSADSQSLFFGPASGGIKKMDLNSGQVRNAFKAEEAQSLKAKQLFFDSTEKFLYFVESESGRIGRILNQ